MSNEHDNRSEPTDDPLESLFIGVEARPRPPADIENEVWRDFHRQWAVQRAARSRRKRGIGLAIAASVLLVLLLQPLSPLWRTSPDGTGSLGQAERYAGTVVVEGAGETFRLASDNMPLQLTEGETLVSAADSGVSIRWGSQGKSLRVDQNTELRLVSPLQVELLSGRVYLDIPPGSNPADALEVVTRFGTIRHTGTQFSAAVTDDELAVTVREGSVAIDDGSQSRTAAAGVRGTLDEAGHYASEPVETYGPDWAWAENLAPGYEIEGRSVLEFLGWVERETGKHCVFDSPDAERRARDTVVHGSGLVMEPMRALDLVLQTNALAWQEQNGRIIISLDH